MEPSFFGQLRRPDLHAAAARAARALLERAGAHPSDDLRSVVGYWQSAELALERAAQSLVAYATALGVHVPPPAIAQPTTPAAPPPEGDAP